MITLCWAAKGGSGTTVTAAALALSTERPTLLIDLAGDLPAVFGLTDPDGVGAHDWLRSEAPPSRIESLESVVDASTWLVPAGSLSGADPDPDRWLALAERLVADGRDIIVDAGTGAPPPSLAHVAERRWLVTRACYLAVRSAVRQAVSPTGIVLVTEPGRTLRRSDIEMSLAAPVVAEILVDPAVARAVDAGLLVARLPGAVRRRLQEAS